MSRLDAALLRAALGHCVIGREIIVLEQTASTNDVVLQMAAPNVGEGLVVLAEEQTAGRGQHGNQWESASGLGLWLSILLRPKIPLEQSARLTDWAARTVAETVRGQFDVSPNVKPPNDVYLADRKIAGVLVEMRAQKNDSHFAIAGIGINVNQTPDDFSSGLRLHAGSLAMALGRSLDRHALAVALLRNLNRTYAENFGGSSTPLLDVVRRRSPKF